MTDRVRLENRILSDMAALASSGAEYRDVVESVLDLIEEVVESPLIALSVRENEQARHYHRVGRDVDEAWSSEAVLFTSEMARQDLARSFARTPARHEHHIAAPPVWVTQFAACMPSDRSYAISLAAGQRVTIERDEEQLMFRLIRHVALLLDHALLLEQLEELEATDRLTGVTNHHRLREILEYEMQRHRHTGRTLAVMMIDVEGLDRINRSYGRQYGNHVLQRLAGMLEDGVRPIDIVARCGFDEFTVVLPESDGDDAERLAERVRERIESAEFAGGTIGLNTGVAHVRPDEALSADGLLRRAENALEASKRQGRTLSALVSRSRGIL